MTDEYGPNRRRPALWRRFLIPHSAFIICFPGPQPIGHAADVAQLANRLAGGQPPNDLQQRPLAHSVDDQVWLGVQQDGAADLVAPIIIMGQPCAGWPRHRRR